MNDVKAPDSEGWMWWADVLRWDDIVVGRLARWKETNASIICTKHYEHWACSVFFLPYPRPRVRLTLLCPFAFAPPSQLQSDSSRALFSASVVSSHVVSCGRIHPNACCGPRRRERSHLHLHLHWCGLSQTRFRPGSPRSSYLIWGYIHINISMFCFVFTLFTVFKDLIDFRNTVDPYRT